MMHGHRVGEPDEEFQETFEDDRQGVSPVVGNTIALAIVFMALGALAFYIVTREGSDSNESQSISDDPAELITDAAVNMDGASSFRLYLDYLSGPNIDLGNEEITGGVDVTFHSADAVYMQPDRLQAEVSVTFLATTDSVDLIAIENQQYINHVLITNGQWQEATFTDFQPGNLQSKEQGIGQILRSMEKLEYLGIEERDGGDMYHIRGTVDAEAVHALTFGLISSTERITVDLYMWTQDRYISEINLKEPVIPEADTLKPGLWKITFSQYDKEFNIERPTVE